MYHQIYARRGKLFDHNSIKYCVHEPYALETNVNLYYEHVIMCLGHLIQENY